MKTNRLNRKGRSRVLRTPEQRQELIQKYRASGLGKSEYCRQRGVNLTTFCQWLNGRLRTKRRRSVSTPKSEMKFAEVQVGLGATAPVEIALASGVNIRLRDLSRWKELVELLRELTRC
jgi:transposase-like protein